MPTTYGIKFRVGNRTHVIEEHSYFGPSRLTKEGNPYKRFWGEHHEFWNHYGAWCQQGKQVDKDDNAVYDLSSYVKPTTIRIDWAEIP